MEFGTNIMPLESKPTLTFFDILLQLISKYSSHGNLQDGSNTKYMSTGAQDIQINLTYYPQNIFNVC